MNPQRTALQRTRCAGGPPVCRFIGIVLFVVGVVLHAGCSDRRTGARIDDSGPPIRGGTLEMVGMNGVIDHLATTTGSGVEMQGLIETFARQLVAYRSAGNEDVRNQPVADLAAESPSPANGGISSDGLTYTFHLRRGVRWDTHPPRDVTAHDVVRAFKLLCNPVAPSNFSDFFVNTLAGMAVYCDAFGHVPGTVEDIRRFVTTRDFEGVRAADEATVVFRLVEPTLDFLNRLTNPVASPVPEEYLDTLPDSPESRQRILSNGPYRIARYVQNGDLLLERNPAWNRDTDPIRPAHVDRIRVRLGFAPPLQQLQIQAGTADLHVGAVPPAELASLLASNDPSLIEAPRAARYPSFIFLAVNRVSHEGRGPLGNRLVRQALAMAVDKASIAQLKGGPRVARPLRQAVPSVVSGFRAGADFYASPGDRGDPAAARRLLTTAGYSSGLSLRLAFVDTPSAVLWAQVLQASLARAGIRIQLSPSTWSDLYGRLLADPVHARRGEWELAMSAWAMEGFPGNGRLNIPGMVESRSFGQNGSNYGGYQNPDVDALMRQASAITDLARAEAAWFEVVQRLMDDVAIVPLVEYKDFHVRSQRVRGCAWSAYSGNCDVNALWLADAAPSPRGN